MSRPSGIPMSAASTSAAAEKPRCSRSLMGMAPGPDQLSGFPKKSINQFTTPSSLASRA
jgi:hypothetical protein